MSAVSDARTVTSAQVRKSIMHAFKKKRPMFLWGPPGIGKSEVVAGITEELGGLMIDLRTWALVTVRASDTADMGCFLSGVKNKLSRYCS